nr:hypothetical protein [Clostridium paraputrificum]
MDWKSWISKWHMSSLKVNAKFLEMEWQPQDADKDAAWELYIELLTRVTTQNLADDNGDELAALSSINKIFDLTREIIKKYKRDCIEFTKIAIIVLNQLIRPFTAKWHKKLSSEVNESDKKIFRDELKELQKSLRLYTQMLGEMAGVEEINDLTMLEG